MNTKFNINKASLALIFCSSALNQVRASKIAAMTHIKTLGSDIPPPIVDSEINKQLVIKDPVSEEFGAS